MAKKNNNRSGAPAAVMRAFAASNPNSRTAAAAAPAPAARSSGAPTAVLQAFAASNPNSRTAQTVAPSPGTPSPSAVAASTAPRTSVQQISNQNTMGQNLRAAGAGSGVLSEKELLKIAQVSRGKNPERVLEKAVGKGLMIGSKVVNQYQKGKYDTKGLSTARMALPEFALAAGKDSQILRQIRNAGKQDKGSALFIGSKGSTATTLPRRLGIGAGNAENPTPETDPTPTDSGTVDSGIDELPPFIPPEEEEPKEEMPPGPGMMAGGGLGALGANKLNRAKSRLRQLGIYGRGTSLLGRGLQYGNALNK